MRFQTFSATLVLCTSLFFTPFALAEVHEVKMLNRDAHAAMAYEPEFLKIAPGDTVKFIASSSGHNAASIAGMVPANTTSFMGKINQEIAITLTEDGLYGVKCSPHYAMGMVMLIQVGENALDSLSIPSDVPESAQKRFKDIVSRATKNR